MVTDHELRMYALRLFEENMALSELLALATECIEDGNDTLAQLIRADDEIRSLRTELGSIAACPECRSKKGLKTSTQIEQAWVEQEASAIIDLLRNIAGLDDGNFYISSHQTLVNGAREWRDEARKILDG
jgi:hypothetical protein